MNDRVDNGTKLETLYNIYDIVKNDPHPTSSMLQSTELILLQACAWDEVVKNLQELESDGLVNMNQRSTALISITEKGLSFMRKTLAHYGKL